MLSLPAVEPPAGPWRLAPVSELVDVLTRAAGQPAGRPRVVAIDGRSAAGKSTLAARLHRAVAASAVVHTDDIAWHHSFFDWADLVADAVLEPLLRGQAVRFRPPAWDRHDRPGAIAVPSGLDLVLVEGVGAGRRELAPLLDAVVWVQSDLVEAERRGIARDVAQGDNGASERATAFWHEWMAEELPFFEDQRTWERACIVVFGGAGAAHADGRVALAPPPTSAPAPRGAPGGAVQEPAMDAIEVLEVLDDLASAGCRCWVAGGWGIDALAGRQTRPHGDLDIALDAIGEQAALEVLERRGYRVVTDWRPVRVEVAAPGGRRVDLHPVTFEDAGNGVQAGLDGKVFTYPAACFVTGTIAGRQVGCLSAQQQVEFHTGYEPREVDLADLALLQRLLLRDQRPT